MVKLYPHIDYQEIEEATGYKLTDYLWQVNNDTSVEIYIDDLEVDYDSETDNEIILETPSNHVKMFLRSIIPAEYDRAYIDICW